MKILAFADLHGDSDLLKKIILRGSQTDIDLLVSAGDLAHFRDNLTRTFTQLNGLGKPVLLIPGNHEDEGEMSKVIGKYSQCVNLHGQHFSFGDYIFLGYGSGGFAREDANFRKIAREWLRQHNGRKIVLVTHAPPFGTPLDEMGANYFVGNLDIRKFIERAQPRLALCGHIHENAGKAGKIGGTAVINPGWTGAVIELK